VNIGSLVVQACGALAVIATLSTCAAPPPPPPTVPSPPPPMPQEIVPQVHVGPKDLSYAGPLEQGGVLRGVVPAGTQTLLFNGKPVQVDDDGSYMVAFDRDAGGEATLVAKLSDGREVRKDLTVKPREWDIERVSAPFRAGKSSAEFERLRGPEIAQIVAARNIRSGSDGWKQDFIWPARGRISGMFGNQRIYAGGVAGSYHSGMDIAAGAGTPFVAPADGVVILAADQPFTLEGKLLMIDHGHGFNSAFLHCSELLVKVGDKVTQGQAIGRVGSTGRATGPHLHWGLKWNDARIDPILLTGPMP
jgi:hypothetical protein